MANLKKPKPCKCGAYKFPHRINSGSCKPAQQGINLVGARSSEWDEELASFNRTAARHVNRGL